MERPPGSPQAWRWYLPALLISTAACKLVLAWVYPGFHSGDDLEIVETAARYAVGFVYEPWGIRSVFHPMLFAAPWVWLGSALGSHGTHGSPGLRRFPRRFSRRPASG